MYELELQLITEMAENIRSCPSCRCTACNESVEVIHKAIENIYRKEREKERD